MPPAGAPRRQRPYADAPLGLPANPTHPRRGPYDEPSPQTVPRRRGPAQPRPDRPDRPGGVGGRNGGNGNGSGHGGRGGGSGGGRGGRGPNDPRGRSGGGGPAGPGGRGRQATRAPRVERRRSWKQRSVLGLLTMIFLLLISSTATGLWFMHKLGQVKVIDDVNVDDVAAGEPANYLIVGSDTRSGNFNRDFGGASEGGAPRADTMMVVRLDPETKAASVISFPRDLVLPIAGSSGAPARLNSAFAQSNQTLIDTLKQNFGIEINRYIIIDFAGFKSLVNAVGGVPIYFERPVKDENTGLDQPAGCVVLDGDQGLAYARSRKLQYLKDNGRWSGQDPFADLGRIERQRVFMELALGKALHDVKSNPRTLFQMVNIGIDNVQVDPVTGEDPLGLAKQFKDFDLANLTTYALPVVDNPNNDHATVVIDDGEAEPILNIFRGLDPGEVNPSRIALTVLNGTATDGLANDAGAALQNVGFSIVSTDNAEPHDRTTVAARGDEQNLATQVARYVTGGADVVVDDSLKKGSVVLTVGANFTTVHEEPTPLDQTPGATTTTAPPPPPGGGTTVPPANTAAPPPMPAETSLNSDYTLGAPCPEE